MNESWKEEVFTVLMVFVLGYYVYSQDLEFLRTTFSPSIIALVAAYGLKKYTDTK